MCEIDKGGGGPRGGFQKGISRALGIFEVKLTLAE